MPTGQHSSSGQWLYSSRLFLQPAPLPCLLSRCDLGLNCDKHFPPFCRFSLAAGSQSHSLSLSAAVLGPQACSSTAGILHSQPSLTVAYKMCRSGGSRAPSPHDSREVITVCGSGAMPFPLWKSRWTILHLLAVGLGLAKWTLNLEQTGTSGSAAADGILPSCCCWEDSCHLSASCPSWSLWSLGFYCGPGLTYHLFWCCESLSVKSFF